MPTVLVPTPTSTDEEVERTGGAYRHGRANVACPVAGAGGYWEGRHTLAARSGVPEAARHVGEHVAVRVVAQRGQQLRQRAAAHEGAVALAAARQVAQRARQLVQRVRRLLRHAARVLGFLCENTRDKPKFVLSSV